MLKIMYKNYFSTITKTCRKSTKCGKEGQMEEFFTIKEDVYAELTEKKSKFIANIFYVENTTEVEEKIKEIKRKYFDAKHNCIAYRVIENDSIIEKSSDDGEPSGTAGAPMLSILQKNNLCNILVIVTRYFGGILLGTGGLVSCYSQVTINGIEKAVKIKKCKGEEIKVEVSYSELEKFKYYCKKNEIKITNIEYLQDISITLELEKTTKIKLTNDIMSKKLNINNIFLLCEKYIEKSI